MMYMHKCLQSRGKQATGQLCALPHQCQTKARRPDDGNMLNTCRLCVPPDGPERGDPITSSGLRAKPHVKPVFRGGNMTRCSSIGKSSFRMSITRCQPDLIGEMSWAPGPHSGTRERQDALRRSSHWVASSPQLMTLPALAGLTVHALAEWARPVSTSQYSVPTVRVSVRTALSVLFLTSLFATSHSLLPYQHFCASI